VKQLDAFQQGEKLEPDPLKLRARSADPDTSHEAMRVFSMNDRRGRILQVLYRHAWLHRMVRDSMTAFDVAEYLGVPIQNLSNNFKPLEEAGYIERNGTTDPVPGKGRRTLWQLTRKGLDWCAAQ
jgi:DNA-binding MarR family transcriptional regulator